MKGKGLLMKILVEVARFLLGATFVFSGFVKAVDPMGTAYKIQDYFLAFGMESFTGLSLTLSIAQAVLEFALGAFMLVGIYRRVTTICVLLVMLFMTPLTLYLAIANPISDCGCFGDAFIISNWQTFYKNIVLLAASVLVVWRFYLITNFFTGKFYWLVGIFTIFYITGFCLYNTTYEPVFDFRPYKIGADLPKLMSVEPGKGDVYENILVYEKDGVKKDFTEENYPWQDSTWTFVEMTTKMIKEGEKPAVQDFEIIRLFFNPEKTEIVADENITQEVLADTGYVFLMIAYSLPEANVSYLSNLEDVSNYANDYGYKFYCLTSSTSDDIIKWEKENAFNYTYCKTDERTLKTITRSNPGLVLLKNGVIINKWASLQVPQESDLIKPLDELSINKVATEEKTNENWRIFLILLFVVPLLTVKFFDFIIYQRKKTIG
ncbi:BT_3928 family protein [Dysgonomonas sp. 520]|uniref:BT_3928 family protein n=1 Tax=Dysgonomonas sp. 520 TaxID=2302931 RepID=UPI0013D7D00A|nr:BT_3928 family protein [Dysgonomonas sp. 520]NDW08193.1 DoxX family protein [Dysgonomonas sp. 520]